MKAIGEGAGWWRHEKKKPNLNISCFFFFFFFFFSLSLFSSLLFSLTFIHSFFFSCFNARKHRKTCGNVAAYAPLNLDGHNAPRPPVYSRTWHGARQGLANFDAPVISKYPFVFSCETIK